MFRLLAGGFALTLVALTAGAQDKKGPKEKDKTAPVWVREVEKVALTFEIGKDTATFKVVIGENSVVMKAKLTKEKDVVTAEFTDIEVKGDFPEKPKKGDKISFKWVEKADTATLSDFKGDGGAEDAKGVVEGEYKKKK